MKIFSILDDKKSIIIKFLFLKMKFNKNKYFSQKKNSSEKSSLKSQVTTKIDVVKYVKQYKYVLNKKIDIKTVSGYDNVIWTCWLQGIDNAPLIIKAAIGTVTQKNPDCKVIVITSENVKQYVDIPQYIKDKHEKGIISNAHFADYIRVCLLLKYGGTWADASCYFTDKIPDEIQNSDFFQFKNYTYFLLKHVPDENVQKIMKKFSPSLDFTHTGSNWFLHAKPNNPIILKMKLLLEEYWLKEDTLVDYFIFHYFLTFVLLYDDTCRNCFDRMPSFNNVYPHLLQNMFEYPYDKHLWNKISEGSFVHKLKWKNVNYPSEAKNFYNFLLKDN